YGGVVEQSVVLAAEVGARVKRAKQRLRGGEPGELVGIVCWNKELLVAHGGDGVLPLRGRARFQKLLERPEAIQAEAEVGVRGGHLHRLIGDMAVNGRDFRLIVRVADVEMDVRNEIQRPLLLGSERGLVTLLPSPPDLGFGSGGEFGNLKFEAAFTEGAAGLDRVAISFAADGELNIGRCCDRLVVADVDIYELIKLAVDLLVE